MTAIRYPVAPNADVALASPRGRAARERDAEGVAGETVLFTTDPVGPAFATREAAMDAYAARVEAVGEDAYCRLAEQIVAGPGKTRPLKAVEPTFEDGHRWPKPPEHPPRTAWRLMVSYWRVASAERPLEAPQARKARRSRKPLPAETVRAMARQPLRPVEPQQPLDIGLFEIRLPENPEIVVPDE